jgi:signal transduction histidine kinase/ActR/RegA family two-component response regulator
MSLRIVKLALHQEQDVVAARQRARQISAMLGFAKPEQTKFATAVSEIARNAFRYAGGGAVLFELEGDTPPQLLIAHVSDNGPGIADLDAILQGRYQSRTGMGMGIVGAHRLVDQCSVETAAGRGTTVRLKKLLPATAGLVTAGRLGSLVADLTAAPAGSIEEAQQQNQELLGTLEELRRRQEELERLTRELEDTNRGVVALYAELDEKAEHLRRADEMKSRFLSNMSHEFRTPLSSIRALTKLLLDRIDGELSAEQETQVRYIRQASEELAQLVDDLLDLSKIEAGKTDVVCTKFDLGETFSALRGMLRPLLVTPSVDLVFDDPAGLPPLYTDEGKVSQILRNFISNALKFTDRGEVRVKARLGSDGQTVRISVQDTGVGIAEQDLGLIFEEFTQVQNRLQQKVKGTGLGLPLCKKLAQLLGGELIVASRPGEGSTFTAVLPLVYAAAAQEAAPAPIEPAQIDPARRPVLIVEEDVITRTLYEDYLRESDYQPILVGNLYDARKAFEQLRPAAVLLDISFPHDTAWRWLVELKAEGSASQSTPVIIATHVDDRRKGLALGADAYFAKPLKRDELYAALAALAPAVVHPS